RQAGAHYTTETNILKALHPLFLDELHAEFDKAKRSKPKLDALRERLSKIRILDPACGCGNFLVIAYRELRLLELKILLLQHKDTATRFLDVSHLVNVNVDQFHGIEIEDWPAQIAQVALWLTDHQMNLRVSEELGQSFARLPLTASPHIVQGNALREDWATVAPNVDYIVGNPPFVGTSYQNAEQKSDMSALFPGIKAAGQLDYVSAWYVKAAHYIQKNSTQCAFVSTNSITQGEQVGILWGHLLSLGVRINFAHRTFRWSSEARGKAAVHCVIIGFSAFDAPHKTIYEYNDPSGEPHPINVENINPYLVEGPNIYLTSRSKPICPIVEMTRGSGATDGGNLLLSDEEKRELLKVEPKAKPWIRPFLMGDEFINGINRWCLWLVDISPTELRAMPAVLKRVEAVKAMRLASKKEATVKIAATPYLFGEIRQPTSSKYLAFPKVSSERRVYIPIGYLDSKVICGDKLFFVSDATLYHFGVLTSTMHMAWTRAVCGRLESRYSYSNTIVYNNFPWPEPTEKKREAIAALAQGVLDVRAKFPEATLADLYDPDTMPRALLKAHQALDKAVDVAYGARKFGSEAERVAFLLARYQALVAGA
ncbi:MAG: N-6 DNA methylase, partial [Deltaproteobacteria bacterium]|nr:N-6 DNA methylase [Deltaproteobacteria bacterium]